MNCDVCQHVGNCPIWKREKAYVQSVNPDTTENYAAMYAVTKDGAFCPHEAGKRVKRWVLATMPGKPKPESKPKKKSARHGRPR